MNDNNTIHIQLAKMINGILIKAISTQFTIFEIQALQMWQLYSHPSTSDFHLKSSSTFTDLLFSAMLLQNERNSFLYSLVLVLGS